MEILFLSYKKIILQILILSLIIFGLFFISAGDSKYPELAKLASMGGYFDTYAPYFQTLAEEKGAVYAFEVLKQAPLSPNIDLHLLAHVVGDELYKQKGPSGIADCTQDFRNACSHTIVIGALNEFGEGEALPLIRDACKRAPGGTGAYTMCFHGLGHGVFAYNDYDFDKTVSFCGKTGTPLYNNREYVECVGGAVMELMGGGVHDRESWLKARNKYISEKDPLTPCSTGTIPRDAKGICYLYLTPRLFEAAGANLANPGPDSFAKAFVMCDKISKSDMDLRQACFSGIGKEFPVLALSRDIRAIGKAGDKELTLMRDWCRLALHNEAYEVCTGSVIDSLFWGGENDPNVSIRFCALGSEIEQSNCFDRIFNDAVIYLPQDNPKRQSICSLVPDEFKSKCREKLTL